MRRKILILSAVLISPFSHAESWESITKSTYQSSAYAESKQITNQDGSKITVYYIDAAMQASACQGAKSSAQSVFTRIKPTYEGIWPDSEFRLVFTGDCTYSDSPGQKDKYWSLTAYIVGNIQRSVPDEKPTDPTPEEICEAKPPEEGVFNNVDSYDGGRYIYYNGCEYEATGVIVCQGDGTVCAATWKPTGAVADPSDKPSTPQNGGGESGGGESGGGESGGGESGGGESGGGESGGGESGGGESGGGESGGGSSGGSSGGGSSGSSLSKGDIQSAIEGASPKIASDIHDKLTEKDTSSDDKKNADEQTRNNINRLDDSINNLTRGAGRFADPSGGDSRYGKGDSELDGASTLADSELGIEKDSHGALWEAFLNKGAMLPNLPNGNGCSDFIIFPGEVYQIDIGCDKLLTIKDVLSWVFYCLTFWYVFTSLTSLLRKGGE
ncbi:attachment protein [Salmonella enterica subsp. enterica serovar Newport]|uniref:Attachment protein n=1 Tax=Salmonella enterica TaxID=28901 RepID=A0A5U4HB67_SALER|nr:attachment protein [Escherichia coli]EAW5867194.1 attachment protein [Salmonella enterica]EBV0436593.1 attachment protein [Salmonella enterica subsp. enterica serovar Brandenburg]ECU7926664.1 attachment protein [Salmonella enterica subsp. enterica serovar Goldcoast]EDV3433214.1 attachment protein [Salmonella enterica subsp. enterica]EDX3058931.1 attachment protein [Salmonella enterica subsp. enterica serovar Johannesburg]EDZ3869315.1 attachment protein [Salmonella enterica subsp. enterica 